MAERLTDERLREVRAEWVPRCPCDTPVLNDGDRCTICEAVESLRAIAREHADRGAKASQQRDRYTSQPLGEFDRHEARRLNALADDLRKLAPAALLAEVEALRAERDEWEADAMEAAEREGKANWARIHAERERDEAAREMAKARQEAMDAATERDRAHEARDSFIHDVSEIIGLSGDDLEDALYHPAENLLPEVAALRADRDTLRQKCHEEAERAESLADEGVVLRLALCRADGEALTRAETEIARRRGERREAIALSALEEQSADALRTGYADLMGDPSSPDYGMREWDEYHAGQRQTPPEAP